ncbi:hypothetical protein [Nonomuraea composti]|uniref:hypothetical protein n=1 Tax=Nonomuraea composti TaxID=2720023 RepID=UPI001980E5C1|nr:hypothetical protein [Nonomuraea sp. FMUSA5-5]
MEEGVRPDEVQWLLDELCTRKGFCLPTEKRQQLLEQSPFTSVDAFTDAVLIAEGMDPSLHKKLREGVRHMAQRHLTAVRHEPQEWPTDA